MLQELKRLTSYQSNFSNNDNNKLDERSKKKLKKIINVHKDSQKNTFNENQTQEYVQYDQQDYNNLDKWKKELLLKQSNNESCKMSFQDIQNLKQDLPMPELNFKIIDSVMNQKYHEENNFSDTSQISQNNDINDPDDNDLQNNSKFGSSSQKNNNGQILNKKEQNFSDSIKEVNHSAKGQNKSQEINSQAGSPTSSPKSPQNKLAYAGSYNQKSAVYLQRNLNKKLLNNLLQNRITKKYSVFSGFLPSSQQDEMEEKSHKKLQIQQNKSSGQSFQQYDNKYKNQSLDVVRHLFSEEAEKFSKTTLSSFKSVGSSFIRLGSVIEYETILKDIVNTIHHPKGIINAKLVEDIRKGNQFDLQTFHYLEKGLLDSYQNCTSQIEDLHRKIHEERLFQTTTSKELKECHEEMDSILTRIDVEDEGLKNDLMQASNNQLFQHAQATRMNLTRFKNIPTTDFKVRQKKIDEERDDIKIYFENLKKAINQRMKSSIEKLEIMDKEILKLKQKRNTTKIILKDLYFKALKSDTHLSTLSLVWIIKSLINISEDISNSNIFPDFLDDQSREFLKQWAKLCIQQDKIQEKIKSAGLNDNINIEQYQSIQLESSKISSTNSREAIKQKVHKISKGSFSYNNRSGDSTPSILKTAQNYFPYYDEINNSQNSMNQPSLKIAFDLNKFPQECIQTVELKFDMRQQYAHIKTIIDKLKENERQRLCKKVTSNIPQYQSKIDDLQQKLNALFGKDEGDAYFNKHLKDVSLFDQKMNDLKSFKFSQINLQNTRTSKRMSDQFNSKDEFPQCLEKSPSIKSINPNISSQDKSQEQNKFIIKISNQKHQEQRLSLNKDTIDNFNEKKKTIVHNQKIPLQYNTLSNYFFKNQIRKSSYQNIEQFPQTNTNTFSNSKNIVQTEPSVNYFGNSNIFSPQNIKNTTNSNNLSFFKKPRNNPSCIY